jgi:hypothetical protein
MESEVVRESIKVKPKVAHNKGHISIKIEMYFNISVPRCQITTISRRHTYDSNHFQFLF